MPKAVDEPVYVATSMGSWTFPAKKDGALVDKDFFDQNYPGVLGVGAVLIGRKLVVSGAGGDFLRHRPGNRDGVIGVAGYIGESGNGAGDAILVGKHDAESFFLINIGIVIPSVTVDIVDPGIILIKKVFINQGAILFCRKGPKAGADD